MKKWFVPAFLIAITVGLLTVHLYRRQQLSTGAPPYGEAETDVPSIGSINPFATWRRPDGPARVGLQVGHWKSAEFPDELAVLRTNTGASGGGTTEWEVNLSIAEETAKILRERGIVVDILPATVPPEYWADAFVAIHADGSLDKSVRGFKIAGPWRDLTGRSDELVAVLETTYEAATNFRKDPNISRNMRGYYAFSWWRYEHAIHPMTTAVIVETGFLSSPADQQILINKPEIPAQGIANGLIAYLTEQDLLK